MSIAPLAHVTVWGVATDKPAVLAGLQGLGCLHLEPLVRAADAADADGGRSASREALRYLLACPYPRRQIVDDSGFDALAVEAQALAIRDRITDLREEADGLEWRIEELRPWGDFDLAPLAGRRDVRLWFYSVPHYQLRAVEALGLVFEVVARDHRFCYVVVVSGEEPVGMPVRRTRTGTRSLSELERRLAAVELEIEDLEADRASLSRWGLLFARALDQLDDQAELAKASSESWDEDGLFALAGWIPREQVAQLEAFAAGHTLALELRAPRRDEEPPTLLSNPAPYDSGADLVRFYTSPGYWTWDPSAAVLVSFTIFFGMIVADAGYGALLALTVLIFWRTLGASPLGLRLRRLGLAVAASTTLCGVLFGSWFGVVPSPGSLPARLQVLDLGDFGSAMLLSLAIGALHLVFANLAEAWRLRRRGLGYTLAPLGWALVIAGGFAFGLGSTREWTTTRSVGGVIGVIGLAAVLLFSGYGASALTRAGRGVIALTRITAVFGDVLSYLRLFALGFASGQLAAAFNDLAHDLHTGRPGLGLALALVVLVIGHGLNLVLCVMSGVVHGLRLNLIEFFNWSVTEEGRPFSAFRRKGDDAWTTSS